MTHVWNELARVEQAALRRGPRTRSGGMRGLGDAASDSPIMTGVAVGGVGLVFTAAAAFFGGSIIGAGYSVSTGRDSAGKAIGIGSAAVIGALGIGASLYATARTASYQTTRGA